MIEPCEVPNWLLVLIGRLVVQNESLRLMVTPQNVAPEPVEEPAE